MLGKIKETRNGSNTDIVLKIRFQKPQVLNTTKQHIQTHNTCHCLAEFTKAINLPATNN